MLDTHARKHVNSIIGWFGDGFIKMNMSANNVTFIAFLVGISAGVLVGFKMTILGAVVLWISGLLDAVDGDIARKTGTTSEFGALMDIVFDRVVEGGIVISLAIRYPESRMIMIILLFAIILSMTVFLTVGALSEKRGIKAFYYQAGLAERTEGFIMFTLMILLPNHLALITGIFAAMILYTAFQRMREAYKIFT